MNEIKPSPSERPPSAQAAEPAQLVENLLAPELFASEAYYFSVGPHVVNITFVAYRFDNSVQPAVQRKVVVGRLVLPIAGAQGLAAGLYDFLKKSGLDPVPPPADSSQVM